MKTLAFVFCYNRPDTLSACLDSLFNNSQFVPQDVVIIDDGSPDKDVLRVIGEMANRHSTKAHIQVMAQPHNKGLSAVATLALAQAREQNPDHLFLIESDYIFRPRGLDTVIDVLTNDEAGKLCFGIVGYDHPNFRRDYWVHTGFSQYMVQQVGEDNINRSVLHRPQQRLGKDYLVEFVSNTCFSCYLNWGLIQACAADLVGFHDLIDQAFSPRDNPSYPLSGHYKSQRVVDDGMLSHAISLYWNRWAIQNGLDRERLAAWLNIIPSVAEHRCQGGMHS